jgi:Membrane bound beta barrel domain (DUF5777)
MKKFILFLFFTSLATAGMAQQPDSIKNASAADSLFNSMNAVNKKENVVVFESPRLILTQTNETIKKKNLNVLFIHRFGDFASSSGGGRYFYGFDNIADVYIGFQYGISDNLNIEIGRSTIPNAGGLADIELKYAVLHQTSDNSSPVAITLIGQTGLRPYNSFATFSDRISYFGQVVFASKLSHRFSVEVAPSIVQNNSPVPDLPGSPKQIFSVSAAARLKLTKLLGVVCDYAHPFGSYRNAVGFSDPLGFGIQAVTGGHVFTINITNSKASSEINYLSNTTSDYARGEYRIGFTISRMFDFTHKETFNPKR